MGYGLKINRAPDVNEFHLRLPVFPAERLDMWLFTMRRLENAGRSEIVSGSHRIPRHDEEDRHRMASSR